MGEDAYDVETVFHSLSDRRRYVALRCLQTHVTVTLSDLAELVVEHETSEDIVAIPPERVRDVYLSLYHTHVPKLVEAELAWYDQEDDLVGVTEHADATLATARRRIESLIRT